MDRGLCGRRIVEPESQPAEGVAIAQDGVPQRFHPLAARADEASLLRAALVDAGRRDAVEPQREPQGFRTQDVVHVGDGIHPQFAGAGGQSPHAPQRTVLALDIHFQQFDIHTSEERPEHRLRGYGDAQIGIGRTQGPQGVGQHRHVAHGRRTHDQQMAGHARPAVLPASRFDAIFSGHRAPD